MGWAGIENGELLRKAVEAGFDAPLTQHEKNAQRPTSNSRDPRRTSIFAASVA
jgi:hypothetical protein